MRPFLSGTTQSEIQGQLIKLYTFIKGLIQSKPVAIGTFDSDGNIEVKEMW